MDSVARAIEQIIPEKNILTILRIVLGMIVVTGGIELAFDADSAVLAASYSDLAKGWISPASRGCNSGYFTN